MPRLQSKSSTKTQPFGEKISLPDSPMCIVGIDPGEKSGAVSIHELWDGKHHTVRITSLPDLFTLRTDLKKLLSQYQREYLIVFMEKPSGVPRHQIGKVGLGSSMKFAEHVGSLRGLLVGMALKHHTVRPQDWQKRLKCLTQGDKKISQAAALQRYPTSNITQRNADAVLIGHYGCLFQFGEV